MKVTEGRLKYLMCLKNMEDCSVTHMAQTIGVAKSTVSRTMEYFEKHGVIFEGGMKLTEYGKQLACEYGENRNLIAEWLKGYTGIHEDAAKQDAVNILVNVSEQTNQTLVQKAKLRRVRERFHKNKIINGKAFCLMLENGTYPFSFTFYKERTVNEDYISMANDGFVHPGTLVVHNGNGIVRLKVKKIERESKLGGLILSGRIHSLKYLAGEKFVLAGQDGYDFFFPATNLSFLYSKEEDILQGNIKMRMDCSVGKMHMPEGTALLTLLL